MGPIQLAEALEAAAAKLREIAARDTPADDGWREWSGGEQPEETYGKVVDIRFRNGSWEPGVPAAIWTWGHSGQSRDIVRYRISAEQPEA